MDGGFLGLSRNISMMRNGGNVETQPANASVLPGWVGPARPAQMQPHIGINDVRPFLTVPGAAPNISAAARVIGAAARHYAMELQAAPDMLVAIQARLGLEPATISRLQIGYAPGNTLGQGIYNELDGRTGLLMDLGLLQERGLGFARSEAMADRVTFPILDRTGAIVGMQGRAIRAGHEPMFVSLSEDSTRKMPMWCGSGKQKALLVETAHDYAGLVQWNLDSCYTCMAMLGAQAERVAAQLTGLGIKQATVVPEQDATGLARALELALALRTQGIAAHVVIDQDRRSASAARLENVGAAERAMLLECEQAPQGRRDAWQATYELAIGTKLRDLDLERRASWMSIAQNVGGLLVLKERGRLMLEAALVD